MKFFHFRKKESPNTEPACSRSCGCTEAIESGTAQEIAAGQPTAHINTIKVLGSGCASCRKQYENAKAAVQSLGLSTQVEYITDLEKIMEYGILSLPAVIINERVASAGKIAPKAEIEKMLKGVNE